MSSKIIKVAVAQTATQQFDFAATLAKCRSLCAEAHAQGVKLIVFPEAFFGGYPKFTNFGAVLGTRTDAGRVDFQKYFHGAIAVPSAESDAIAALAKEFDLSIVSGLVEKAGSSLFCSSIYVDPVAGVLGTHRKVMPTASEKLIWSNGSGSTANLSAHTLRLGAEDNAATVRAAAGICWENMMPLLRYNYYQQDIQLYLAVTVDGRENWTNSMVHIAMESRCFVLSANQYATAKDYPEWHQASLAQALNADGSSQPLDPETEIIAGGSCIISPLGQVLAGPLRKAEGILTAEINLEEIIGARYDLDPTGHYSRSDIFALNINRGHDV